MLSKDRGKEHIGRGSLLNDAGFRAGVAQAVVLLLLVGAVCFFSYNVYQNLTRAGITTGFAFLSQPAGFDVSQSLIDYSSRSTYADALLVGILNTLLVSAMGIVCSTILGFFLGVIR
ncbi:MAG TPA: amino acid ABC transporter permease, partial [Desulforhopalus sp.]|nr:amino acid ABC transporter permease [Desulforhopalus sp.]